MTNQDDLTLHMPIAQPLRDETIGTLTVVFDQPVAPVASKGSDLDACRRWYADRADDLLVVMERHVPGGFMDALLGRLLARKAIAFVVPDPVLVEEVAADGSLPAVVIEKRRHALQGGVSSSFYACGPTRPSLSLARADAEMLSGGEGEHR